MGNGMRATSLSIKAVTVAAVARGDTDHCHPCPTLIAVNWLYSMPGGGAEAHRVDQDVVLVPVDLLGAIVATAPLFPWS